MKRFILPLIAVFMAFSASSQDIHFSQFNASPLTLNPAITGKLECTYRAALNYRNQWNAVPAPYVTYSAAFDAALWKNQLGGDVVGLGLLMTNDKSGDGELTNMSLGASLAYHKQIGENHYLSAGFQAAYVQFNVDFSKLIFGNQIGPGGYLGTPTTETYIPGFNYVDLNAGLHWSSVVSDNFSFNLGGAYYHLLNPNRSFLYDDNQLESRYIGHGGFSVAMGDDFSLSPSVLYMTQAETSDINVGTSLGYHMEGAVLYFGSWYRLNDAVIALVGLQFQNLMFGFSYDVTISDVSAANANKGGFELSLTYNGCIKTEKKVTHCPTF